MAERNVFLPFKWTPAASQQDEETRFFIDFRAVLRVHFRLSFTVSGHYQYFRSREGCRSVILPFSLLESPSVFVSRE